MGRVLDPLLAVGLAVVGLIDIWIVAPSETYAFEGNLLAHTAFLLVVCLCVAFRRRVPVVAATGLVLGTTVWWLTLIPRDTSPPFEAFLGLLAVAYTVGTHTSGRQTALGVGALLLIIPPDVASLAAGRAVGDTVPAWFFTGLFFGMGRLIRHQRTMAHDLETRAEQLRREQAETARLAAELERTRLARELHDVVTHNVSLMVIQASVERRALDEDGTVGEALAAIEDVGRETLAELRRLVGVMRTNSDRAALAPQPTLADLPELVERTREAGLDVDLIVEGEHRRIPTGVGLAAYRIAQEALTNTMKHASARHARVVVRYDPSEVVLEVTDDGVGPSGERDGAGNGQDGMRERVAMYDGSLRLGTARGGGYEVVARLPTSAVAT